MACPETEDQMRFYDRVRRLHVFPALKPYAVFFGSVDFEYPGPSSSNSKLLDQRPVLMFEAPRELAAEAYGVPHGTFPATERSIKAMPVVTVAAGGDGGTCCSICFKELQAGKEMPCKHRFHADCIEKWLRINGLCPVCRYPMPTVVKFMGGRKRRRRQSTNLDSGAVQEPPNGDAFDDERNG